MAEEPVVEEKVVKKKPVAAKRFNLFHRFVHGVILLGVTGAIVTGFPLKYKDFYGMEWLVQKMGGVSMVGLIHRISATMIIVYLLFQGAYMFYYVIITRLRPEVGALTWILPRKRETLDIKANILYLLGRRPEPSFKRFVYWGVFDWVISIAGMVAILISGCAIWFHRSLAQLIPGTWLNTAYVIHSNGAVLVVVITLVTHFYNIYWSTGHISDCMVIVTGRVTARRKKLE